MAPHSKDSVNLDVAPILIWRTRLRASSREVLMFLRRLISSFTLSLWLIYSGYAQPAGTESATSQERQAGRKDLEQKAFALLEEVIAQAPTLRLAENRAMIQATAAGLIWKQDEKQARAVFKAAIASLVEITSAMDQSDPQYDSLAQTMSQARLNLLDVITQFDPQLALDFLQATRQPSPPRNYSSYSPPDIEMQLEGRLAGLIAAKDPQRALQLARASLAKGLSSELISTLSQLRSSDKAAAAALSQEIIARLKAENKMTPDVSGIAFSLAYMLQSQKGDEQSFRELLNLLVGSALNTSLRSGINQSELYLAQNLLSQLRPLMPEIDKYVPSRGAAMRQKFAELDRVSDLHNRSLTDLHKLTPDGTEEEALEAAAKAPPESRGPLGYGYQYDSARQIASGEAKGPIQREEMLKENDQQAVWQMINQGRLDEAHQMAMKLRSGDERASALIQLAGMAANQNAPDGARQFLAEAFDAIDGKAASYQRLQTKLQLAQAYATFDRDRSFEIMALIIDQLNELMAAAATLDGFENNYLKNGEWIPSGGGALSNMVVACNQQIAVLARDDFDRAKSLADSWQRSEVRLRVKLMIAQSVLSG
jgi:hypothetical protein